MEIRDWKQYLAEGVREQIANEIRKNGRAVDKIPTTVKKNHSLNVWGQLAPFATITMPSMKSPPIKHRANTTPTGPRSGTAILIAENDDAQISDSISNNGISHIFESEFMKDIYPRTCNLCIW